MVVLGEGLQDVHERLKLILSGKIDAEIADERDANSDFIHAIRFAVRTDLLLDPSGGDLDLAVAFSQRAIVDEEMIAQSVPKSTVFMSPVDLKGLADIRGRMMNDDVFPS